MLHCFVVFCAVIYHVVSGQLTQQLYDVDSQLAKLTSSFKLINDQLEDTVKSSKERSFTIRLMNVRLDRNPGTSRGICDEGWFSCGVDSVQCVSNILVCDGTQECMNGGDERPEVCEFPFNKGTAIVQTSAPISKCESINRIIKDRWVVYDTVFPPWFTSFPSVQWNYQADVTDGSTEGTVMLLGSGRYRYATSEIVLPFLEGGYRVGTCWVERISPDKTTLHCYVYRARLYDSPCMYAVYNLEDTK